MAGGKDTITINYNLYTSSSREKSMILGKTEA